MAKSERSSVIHSRVSNRGLSAFIKSEIKKRVNKEKLVRKFNLKMFDEVIKSLVGECH